MRQGGRTSPSSMTTSRRTIRRSGSSGAAASSKHGETTTSSCWKSVCKVPLRADGRKGPSLTADGRTEPAKRGGFLKRKPPLLQPMEKIASGIQQVCIRPFEEPRRRGRAALLGGELSSSAAAGAVFALDHPLFLQAGKPFSRRIFGNAISLTGEKGRPFVRKAAPCFGFVFIWNPWRSCRSSPESK